MKVVRACSIDGCRAPHLALGLCGRHYRRRRMDRYVEPPETKVCTRCGVEKPIDAFSKHSSTKDQRRHECRECHAIYHREERARKPRNYYRRYELKRNYKMTVEQFDEMFAAQDGKCAICGGAPGTVRGRLNTLYVDHDHKTGAVRKLLCHKCNAGLGSFCDDPGLLVKAAQYIAQHTGG